MKAQRISAHYLIVIAVMAVVAMMPAKGKASVTFVVNNGTISGVSSPLSASAVFEIVNSGNALQITLKNTASTAQGAGAVLTNIEFNLSGATLGLDHLAQGGTDKVVVADGSSIVGTVPSGFSGTDVSGAWVFGTNVSPAGVSATLDYGISATAFDDRGTTVSRFNGGTNYGAAGDSTEQINGSDWGLIPKNNPGNVGNNSPWVADSVVITISLANGSLTNLSSQLSSVYFTYGSAQDGIEGGIEGHMVPEPSTIAMALTALVPLGFAGLRRFRRRSDVTSA